VKTFLDEEYLEGQYSKDWVDMLHMEYGMGVEIVAGVWQRANGKSFVWYPVQEFEDNGYQVPETWEELVALMDQMVEDGYAPWSIGFESGQATGWGVQLPGWQYPVVCDTATGQVSYDNYEGHWGDRRQLDRFLQAYAVEKARIESRRNGHTLTEQPLADGSVKLTVQIGGAV
jgi:ABC-type glycerol-3-phosphate transport system substrate-binding protein